MARRYEFYVRMARTISHSFAKQTWVKHVRNLLIVLTVFQEIIQSTPVFMRKGVAKKIICNTKHPVSLLHPRKSENRAVRNRIQLRNGLRKKVCERDKAGKLREIAILAGKVYLKIIILVTKRPCTKLVKLLRVMGLCFCTLHLNQKSRESKFL